MREAPPSKLFKRPARMRDRAPQVLDVGVRAGQWRWVGRWTVVLRATKISANDPPSTRGVVMAKVEIARSHKDVFVVVDGIRVARRGYPGTPEARTWVSVEPGWQVLDSDEGIIVLHNGVGVN